jgi:hypothetical protein
MVVVLAAAKTSTGAPCAIWAARVSEPPNDGTTFTPGWSCWKFAARVVNVAARDDAANTTTVPEMLGAIGPAELAGAALLDAAGAAEDVSGGADDAAVLGAAAAADVPELAGDDGADAAFFEELHPARPSATTTVVTMTADACRFMNSPKRVKGRRLFGVRY